MNMGVWLFLMQIAVFFAVQLYHRTLAELAFAVHSDERVGSERGGKVAFEAGRIEIVLAAPADIAVG